MSNSTVALPVDVSAAVAPPARFTYSEWRHGGWYVHDVRYPSGACGCVSRNYDDGKWRIVCGDHSMTYRTRDAAARAEFAIAAAKRAALALTTPSEAIAPTQGNSDMVTTSAQATELEEDDAAVIAASHLSRSALMDAAREAEALTAPVAIEASQRKSLIRAIVSRFGPIGVGFEYKLTVLTPYTARITDTESQSWIEGNFAGSSMVVVAEHDASASPVAMVAQPSQQQQAKARAPKPARGERRYVTVRDTETGEIHRVLTSIAHVGVAVVIFSPSNRHREGALGGMLITHDDIRKAWVFNDDAEARRMLSNNRAPGERVIRAELVADPAPAVEMVPQPVQQAQARDLRGMIHIRDLTDIPTPSHDTYAPAEMEAARAEMVSRNLRLDNRTGTVSDDRLGLLSRFSDPSDHVPHASLEEAMRWAFRPCIANSASRVRHGYSA